MRPLVYLLLFFVAAIAAVPCRVTAASAPEAILVITGDQHSAYERTAQFVARIDRLRAENPGVPFAILINGDALEYGNAVARRTKGAIDFALLHALAQRAPTVVNLGNHEPEFYDVSETVRRLASTGARVVGNLRERATGELFAPASLRLQLGAHEAVLVGLTTDRLNTYRIAIRPQLDLADPVVWAREKFPALLRDASLPIVLSHSGLRPDRAILPLVPAGTLFAGAHDHLRFVHREGATSDAPGRTIYFHSGSWLDFISIARLRRMAVAKAADTHSTRGELYWDVEQVALNPDDPANPALASLIRETLARHLTPEETAIVGHLSHALAPAEAAMFAVEAARRAAGGDAALIGATTFGAGLPAGEVTRFAFDACVRFDGTLHIGEIDGAALQQLVAGANQGPDTPFAARRGENIVVVAPPHIEATRRYRLVTTDWVSKNPRDYLGKHPPALTERPELKLKAAVITALAAPTR